MSLFGIFVVSIFPSNWYCNYHLNIVILLFLYILSQYIIYISPLFICTKETTLRNPFFKVDWFCNFASLFSILLHKWRGPGFFVYCVNIKFNLYIIMPVNSQWIIFFSVKSNLIHFCCPKLLLLCFTICSTFWLVEIRWFEGVHWYSVPLAYHQIC